MDSGSRRRICPLAAKRPQLRERGYYGIYKRNGLFDLPPGESGQ
jgi:hypothetical protein